MGHLWVAEGQAFEVDHVDVGKTPGNEPTPIGDAEQVGWLGGEAPDGILQGEAPLVAHPVGEEEGGLAGIHDEGGVGAGIGQTEGHMGTGQHVQHLVEVLVQDRPCEDPPPVHLDEEIQHRLGHRHPALSGDGRDAVLGGEDVTDRPVAQRVDAGPVDSAVGHRPLSLGQQGGPGDRVAQASHPPL